MRAPSLHLTAQAIAVGSAHPMRGCGAGKEACLQQVDRKTHEVDLTPVQPRSERSEYEQTSG